MFIAPSSFRFGNPLAVSVTQISDMPGVFMTVPQILRREWGRVGSWLEFSLYGSDGTWA